MSTDPHPHYSRDKVIRQPLVIIHDPDQGWWALTFFNGKVKNYANLKTLFGAIEDYYTTDGIHRHE